VAPLTYETVLAELYAALPEFYDEDMGTDEYDDEERAWQSMVFGEFVIWLQTLALNSRDEVLRRAAAFVERLVEDAERDSELWNLFLIEFGEGFPFYPEVVAAFGPMTSDLLDRERRGADISWPGEAN
jgi:hypothetical protein